MNYIKLKDFVNRVMTSRERVQFSHVDPYSHLNASRYIEFFMNHRVTAAEIQLQCFTMDIAKELHVGLVVQEINCKYLSSALLSDELEIGSWISEFDQQGFSIQGGISKLRNGKECARLSAKLRAVQFATGKPTSMPEALPTRSDENLISKLPFVDDYLRADR